MKKHLHLGFVASISSLPFIPFAESRLAVAQLDSTSIYVSQTLQKSETATHYMGLVADVDKIAEQVTVRIDSKDPGSGVIVAQQGSTYTVLTAGHVVLDSNQIMVMTPDGHSYGVKKATVKKLEGIDMAVLEFTSPRSYLVATLANYPINESIARNNKLWVFMSGFPAQNPNPQNHAARQLTSGVVYPQEVSLIAARNAYFIKDAGLEDLLYYSAISLRGMSGGPILDRSGRVIGVNVSSEDAMETNQNGQSVEINLGFSLGVSIRSFLNSLTKATLNSSQLNTVSEPPSELKPLEIELIKINFVPLEPAKSADAFEWLNYGNKLWRIREYDRAVAAFNQAIQLEPNFYHAYYAKGLALSGTLSETISASGKININAEQLVAYDKALQINPKLAEVWYRRNFVLIRMGRFQDAVVSMQRAIALRPDDPALYLRYGILHSAPEALAIFCWNPRLEVIVRNPKSAFRGVNLKAHKINNDPEKAKCLSEAEASFSKAIELIPSYIAYSLRGETRRQLKNYPGALSDYDQAIKLNRNYSQVYSDRGEIRIELGDTQGALSDYNQMIGLNAKIGYAKRGKLRAQLGNKLEAISDFTQAIKISDSYEYYFSRGQIYSEIGKYLEAIADYNQVIIQFPEHAEAYLNLGIIRSKLGDQKTAISSLQKAASLFDKEGKKIDHQKALDLIQKLQSQFTKGE